MTPSIPCEFNKEDFLIPYETRLDGMKNRHYRAKIKIRQNDYKYRSIILPMKTILIILYYGELDAYNQKKQFPGLTEKQLEILMKNVWVSVDNIHNYLYRLTRLKYLIRSHYKQSTRNSKYYYVINPNRFLCHRGEYVLYKSGQKQKPFLMIGSCPFYLFCNCTPEVCVYFDKLKERIQYMTELNDSDISNLPFFTYYAQKLQEWKSYSVGYKSCMNNLIQFLEKNGYSGDIVQKLYDQEIIYYWQLLESHQKSEDCKNIVTDIYQQISKNITKSKNNKDIAYEYDTDELVTNICSAENDITNDPTNGRGLFPAMSNVLQIVNMGEKIAEKLNKSFSGMTVYNIESVLEELPVSKDTTSDTVYRLLRLAYLEQNYYQKSDSNPNSHFFFINHQRFPCHLGSYTLYYPHTKSNQNICINMCNRHISCNLAINQCKLIEVIREQIGDIIEPYKLTDSPSKRSHTICWKTLPFFQYLDQMFIIWNDDEKKLEYYAELVCELLEDIRVNPEDIDPIYTELINAEIIYYGKKLDSITENSDRICLRDEIVELIRIKRNKNVKQYTKQSKQEIELKQEFREKLLKILLTTPETQKPPINTILQEYARK